MTWTGKHISGVCKSVFQRTFVCIAVPGGKFWTLGCQSAVLCISWHQLLSQSKISSARCKRCGTWAACSATWRLFREVRIPPFATDASPAVSKHKLSIQHVSGSCIRPRLWSSGRLVTRSCCSCKGLQFRRIIGAWNTCKHNHRIQYTVNLIFWYCFELVFLVVISAFSALIVGCQEGHPACKNWVVGCWRCYLSEARCRLAYGLADATATHCLLLQ